MAGKRQQDMTDEERKAAQERMAKARAAAAKKRAARMQHQGMPTAPESQSSPTAVDHEQPPSPEKSAQSAETEPARLPLSDEKLGQFAKNLTGNPATEAAFQRAIDECVTAWENTEPTQTSEREALYHYRRALQAWRYHLGRIAVAGEQARKSRERLSTVA